MNRRFLATAGISSNESRSIGSLLRFLQRSLNSEWTIAEAADHADAVLVDLGSASGRQNWELAKSSGRMCIAVSSSAVPDAPFQVKRPWHRDGEHSLTRALNLIDHRLQVVTTKQSAAVSPTPRPHAESVTSLLDSFLSSQSALHATVRTHSPEAHPALSAPKEVSPARASTQQGLPKGPSLLSAISTLKTEKRSGYLHVAGIAPIHVDAQAGRFTSSLSLPNLLRELRAHAGAPCDIHPLHAELLPGSKWLLLQQLEWLARITSPDPPDYDGGLIQLTRWPQFIQYPCEVAHLRMASVLLKQQLTISGLAELTEGSCAEAAQFVHACDLLGLTRHQAAPPPAAPFQGATSFPVTQPAQPPMPPREEPATGKASIFKRILSAIRSRTS